jgi:ABC-type transporter Mla subunit MlaD
VAGGGFTIPSSRTLTDIDLDEVLAGLDTDTREHLQLLLGGAAGGLKGRSMDLAELFRRFGPTTRDLRRVNEAVAGEREGLKDAIHGLAQVTNELAGKDDDLARLVDSSASVFESFASEDRNVSQTVAKLPGALRTTTAALGQVKRFADQLGPTSQSLIPVFDQLDRTNAVITPVARRLTPVLRDEVRPFVREARPLVADLRPAANGLAKAMPDLTTVGSKLNVLFNLLAFNPDGREPADKASRQEGYLFWLAWLTHQTSNLINTDDANGPMRPIFLTGTCQTITNLVNGEPGLEFLLGLSGVLADACNNPTTTSILPAKVRKQVEKQAKALDRTRAATKKLLGGER